MTLLRCFRWKPSFFLFFFFFWMLFSLVFITYKAVAMQYLLLLMTFCDSCSHRKFLRKKYLVFRPMGWLALKSLRKSIVEHIVYQISIACLNTKPLTLLPFLPCFIFCLHFSLLLSSLLVFSSLPSSACQLVYMGRVSYYKPIDFWWFFISSIHHLYGSHSCSSPQQQHRGG